MPNFLTLSQALPGTYEDNMMKQLLKPSDDTRSFNTPFHEETSNSDLLRRVQNSELDWETFINGCK